jgi:hypothetical protein
MALKQTLRAEPNPDGTPHVLNEWTPLDGEDTIHVVQTGPISGPVTMTDGTTYDLTPPHIQVSESHKNEVHFHIAKKYEAEGRLTQIVHGPDWAGTPATVTGTPDSFSVVPGVLAAPGQ